MHSRSFLQFEPIFDSYLLIVAVALLLLLSLWFAGLYRPVSIRRKKHVVGAAFTRDCIGVRVVAPSCLDDVHVQSRAISASCVTGQQPQYAGD